MGEKDALRLQSRDDLVDFGRHRECLVWCIGGVSGQLIGVIPRFVGLGESYNGRWPVECSRR